MPGATRSEKRTRPIGRVLFSLPNGRARGLAVTEPHAADGGQAGDDLLEVLAAIFAHPDGTVGHAGEEHFRILRIADETAWDGTEVRRHGARQHVPGAALVLTAS